MSAQTMGGEKLKSVIEVLIKKHWPKSHVALRYKPAGNVYRDSDSSIVIQFALFEKKDWPNGILHNDPSLHNIWIWGADSPIKRLERSMGGSIMIRDVDGPNAFKSVKVGWRNTKGDDKKIIRTLDNYFGTKLKRVVEQYKDELDSLRASNRYANQDLRAGLIRLAHENPEFRKDLLPLLKA